MLGDKIVVKPHHTKAAEGVYKKIRDRVVNSTRRVAITVAGESGSGKSEIASEIARLFCEKDNLESITFHQDDYFKLPPISNDGARRKDIGNVGIHEVRMDELNRHILYAKEQGKLITKPLIDFDNNKILEEKVDVAGKKIIIAEGTYTTTLTDADIRVFIDRTYVDTLQHRKERARDMLDDYTEKILEIEHGIISMHKEKADIIINRDYSVQE